MRQERPVFVVRCREYAAATNWDRTKFIDFLVDRYNSEYSDDIDASVIRDILTLGRAVLVLDGLDESTDPLRRIDLVKAINSISSMFPLLSLLVTSREVGYDRAPVDVRIFTRVALTEFELDQAKAYVERWFSLVGKARVDRPIYARFRVGARPPTQSINALATLHPLSRERCYTQQTAGISTLSVRGYCSTVGIVIDKSRSTDRYPISPIP